MSMVNETPRVGLATPAGIARTNKWLVSENERQAAPCRWAENTLATLSLSTDPADYILNSDGGNRLTSHTMSPEAIEAPWFMALADAIKEYGRIYGSREHVAAALLVVLAFAGSFVRTAKAGQAAEAAFRAGLLWEAVCQEEDAALGRIALKLQPARAARMHTYLWEPLTGIGRRESLVAEAERWAQVILADEGLPTCAGCYEPDELGRLRPAPTMRTPRSSWSAPLDHAVLKIGHQETSPIRWAAELLERLAAARRSIAADEVEGAAVGGFEAGVARWAVNRDLYAQRGLERRVYTAKGGRRKGDDEEHGRWWLAHQRLRRMLPRSLYAEASDRNLAKAIGEQFGVDPDTVRIAVARMNAWKPKSER